MKGVASRGDIKIFAIETQRPLLLPKDQVMAAVEGQVRRQTRSHG